MVKVQILRGHNTVYWIPEKYWEQLHIIPDDSDKLDFERDTNKPLVVIPHGTGDITKPCVIPKIRDCYSLLYADYYLSTTKQEHDSLKAKGKNTYYTGSAFTDFTTPEKRKPDMLIYVPDHGIPIANAKNKFFHSRKPMTDNDLSYFCTKYGCRNYITSALDEDRRLSKYKNIALSNRNTPLEHHLKCKKLYEVAKIVIEDNSGTFGVTAKAHGIEVFPKQPLDTLADGKCRERIIEALDDILKKIQ